MANASISGLASGLDTASIISQLMQLEAQPQTRLKSQLTSAQSSLKSLQDLNAKIAALATEAGKLAKTTGWTGVKVTSSSDLVTATADSGAVTGTLDFTVGQLAARHRLAFTDSAALSAVVTSGSTVVRIDNLDGTTKDVDTGDGTLGGLVSALNAAGTGVRATTVKLDDGTYRLSVTSATTGAASDFTLKNLDGTDLLGGAAVTAGQDAAITVGADTVHSASNTFTGVLSGVTVTLQPGLAPGTAVSLTLAEDTSALKASVKSLVDNINAQLTSIDSLTAYTSATKTRGALHGDPAVRSLREALVTSIYPGDGTSMAGVGIQVDRYGKLTFDEAAFDKAYAADPAAVRDKFTAGAVDGFAARVESIAKSASSSADGTLTLAIQRRNTSIDRLQDDISTWDARLQLRQQTLTRQFTALETALGQMTSQSSWLAGQIGSLPQSTT